MPRFAKRGAPFSIVCVCVCVCVVLRTPPPPHCRTPTRGSLSPPPPTVRPRRATAAPCPDFPCHFQVCALKGAAPPAEQRPLLSSPLRSPPPSAPSTRSLGSPPTLARLNGPPAPPPPGGSVPNAARRPQPGRARPDPFLSALLQRQGARGRRPIAAVSRRSGTFKGRGRLPGTHVTFGPPKLRLHGRGTAGRARAAFRFLFQEGKHWWAAGAAAAAPALSLPPPASRSPLCPAHTRAHTRAVPHTRAHGHARRGAAASERPPERGGGEGTPGSSAGRGGGRNFLLRGRRGAGGGKSPRSSRPPAGLRGAPPERCLSLLPSAASR